MKERRRNVGRGGLIFSALSLSLSLTRYGLCFLYSSRSNRRSRGVRTLSGAQGDTLWSYEKCTVGPKFLIQPLENDTVLQFALFFVLINPTVKDFTQMTGLDITMRVIIGTLITSIKASSTHLNLWYPICPCQWRSHMGTPSPELFIIFF